ncbi:MAG: nuclear export factor GLE1 [Microbacterium sp. SCN 70-200]|uniref:DUF1775 domain-containing protein n=1 Tax=unclassified Microbacterium TaxID=2609290 RepID=UPI00086C7FC6|nr:MULTISPECIES: DUF1775 domain-containing protein [unclassified Microbacterium]MBN9213985.1 DUF1775 domain-containing protein [Microbacterium sp.]ODT39456.1 MAG: nuclear export factor GLE1 [Microbacterium sp. SCN 70-200]OJV86181.1 MAG: nuclear export factor GLE1 [Microbacterium sp. 70-16]
MSSTSSRRRARLTAGVIAGAALVLVAPLAASAHVHVSPEESAAGTSTRLDFSFSHGCDDSPTTAVTFTIPEGVDGVTPVLDGAWIITRTLGDDGIPTEVTYTAVTPVESGVSASIALDVIFSSSASGTDVAFPVLQQCVIGETDWAEVAADGQTEDDLESPAPVVAVGAVSTDTGHSHSDASDDADATDATDATDAAEHTDHATDDAATETASDADPVARWLSGGALVAALAALGFAIAGWRRRRS